MTLNFVMNTEREELKPRITVFGVGGAGGNAVNNMIERDLEGVEFVVANTDSQALMQSRANATIQIGQHLTKGLGAGAKPDIGAAAAEESIEQIVEYLAGSHMCFITAGMGGGTGTGAAPIIAQAARELGVLTVGVVTKPFQFEGVKRMRLAEEGVAALHKVVDTLIIIPNQNLFRVANEKTSFTDSFAMADDVLYQGVKGVTDLMVRPGLINLDFADVRSVMNEMGKAMMGTGEARGEDRAVQAAEKAIANPLLDEISLNGARGVLINITGGHDLTLFELDEAANIIREKVDPEANIIVGTTLDPSMEGVIRVSVVATGIDAAAAGRAEAASARRAVAAPPPPVQAPASARMADSRPEPHLTLRPDQQAGRSAQAEPSLFETVSPEPESNPADGSPDHDLPPPAYRPQDQMLPARGFAAAAVRDEDPAAFVAPRARALGQPTAETLARLQAAASKLPSRDSAALQSPQQRMAAPAPRTAEKPRFGIGPLIKRMSGQTETSVAPSRQQPSMGGYDDDADLNAPDDRSEIPAFLRRQAN
jgi:cell division protein FtsZ